MNICKHTHFYFVQSKCTFQQIVKEKHIVYSQKFILNMLQSLEYVSSSLHDLIEYSWFEDNALNLVGSEGLLYYGIGPDVYGWAIEATYDTFKASNCRKVARMGDQTQDFPSWQCVATSCSIGQKFFDKSWMRNSI